MDIVGVIGIFEKFFKGGRYLFERHKKNPSHYLEGPLTSGLDIAYRIIALFEAHDVKRTQIYRLLGDSFPEIKPSLDAEKLQSILNGELIDKVCELFGVRKAWVEGEPGRIYEPLYHYKGFRDFVDFVRELTERNPENLCLLTALKPSGTADDLYKESPEVALFFSEPIAELDRKTIYRYYPIYGPFPWGHTPARYHLCAFLNVVDRTRNLIVKGYSVPQKQISRLSDGNVIPHYQMKATGVWCPENYGYPFGRTIGRLKAEDWQGLIEYFDKAEEFKIFNQDFRVKSLLG